MKKLLSILMIVVLAFASMLVFVGCGEESGLPEAPKGYKMYENDEIYFAYPESWTNTEIRGYVQLKPSAGGNNITVAKSQYDSTFDNMTVDTFNQHLLPSLVQAGASVSNVKVEHDTTKGFDITVVTYDASYSTISMKQVIYMFKLGEAIYTISINEVVDDLTLIQTVFNTLAIK